MNWLAPQHFSSVSSSNVLEHLNFVVLSINCLRFRTNKAKEVSLPILQGIMGKQLLYRLVCCTCPQLYACLMMHHGLSLRQYALMAPRSFFIIGIHKIVSKSPRT